MSQNGYGMGGGKLRSIRTRCYTLTLLSQKSGFRDGSRPGVFNRENLNIGSPAGLRPPRPRRATRFAAPHATCWTMEKVEESLGKHNLRLRCSARARAEDTRDQSTKTLLADAMPRECGELARLAHSLKHNKPPWKLGDRTAPYPKHAETWPWPWGTRTPPTPDRPPTSMAL